jgi:hypothetical protein
MAPVIVPPARGNFVAIELVTVVENDASLPRAVANSLSVSRAAGADATRLDTAVPTNAVVATWVVLVPAVAVGAAGTPVNVGDAIGAYVLDAVAVANLESI